MRTIIKGKVNTFLILLSLALIYLLTEATSAMQLAMLFLQITHVYFLKIMLLKQKGCHNMFPCYIS